MSKAFTKEQEGSDVYDELPERPVSSNYLVTERGLKMIDDELAALNEAHAEALAEDDKQRLARINRDLRYFTARRATAQLVPPPDQTAEVRFGNKVTIERDDGRTQTFTIVGEDEADPSNGTLSYVSPVAQALMGRSVGDLVAAGTGEAEIIEIR
ncbi:Transcription elongation factor GreB [Methyloligella halotolerans]|uniref:Transcription elongation factor GreB n=1 Tax=Methyloligella halotolerans TaxID=1177755 RepID=A0A1E2RY31_9HYPH|nr:transcription elongation factor GreA [Methyloligella halotolerans]ODA67008.1 Transcription elongation factor GreB [Methyloligella halotolerans]